MTRLKGIIFLSVFLAVTLVSLGSCASNRVSLGYATITDPSVRMTDKSLVVATLVDHRFRLYSFGANSMGDVAGWGQGTGTLTTPENIPVHVTRALVHQYQTFGGNAVFRPDVSCHLSKSSDGNYSVRSSYPGPVLCGSILDYQFQIDHATVGFGTYISTFDMTAGATLKAQVALHLFLVQGTRILWQGYVGSADGQKDIKGPNLRQKGVALLEHSLGMAIEQSVPDISSGLGKV